MRLLLPVVIASLLNACAPRVNDTTLLATLQTQLEDLPHECVPLGWTPVPLQGGVYYPGFSAESQDASWLKPLWLGSIRTADLHNRQVAVTHRLLAHLRRAGMIESVEIPGGTRYRASGAGFKYYYDGNAFKSNPDHLRYFCYSKVVPSKVRSLLYIGPDKIRVSFQWSGSARAAWSADPFIRAHSVVLSPFTTPATAYLKHDDPGTEKLPRVVNASAWHTTRS